MNNLATTSREKKYQHAKVRLDEPGGLRKITEQTPEQVIDTETLNEIETAIRIITKSDKQIGEVVLIVHGNEKPYVDIRFPAGSPMNLLGRLFE